MELLFFIFNNNVKIEFDYAFLAYVIHAFIKYLLKIIIDELKNNKYSN